jgi:glutamine amidotransferase
MQLLGRASEEGSMPGLGWIEAESVRFSFGADQAGLKIPHMGWNSVSAVRSTPLFAPMPEDPRFYFVHSYHLVCREQNDVLAVARYGFDFTAAVARRNIMGVQFHPEKSHKFGMQLLKNFAERGADA